jgi:1-phosphatidylinositol phosphodiesterase
MPTKTFLVFCSLLSLLLITSRSQLLYNWNPTSMRNQTWMAALDYGLPLREMSMVGTQNSVVFDSCFFITATTQERQANSLQVQLESGIRAIDIHVKHLNNQFQISDRGCAQGTSFNQVLTTVKNFLTTYPS